MPYWSRSSDAGAGNVMRIGCKTMLTEDVIACFHDSLIVDINMGNVNPCAYQIALHGQVFTFYGVEVFFKEQ